MEIVLLRHGLPKIDKDQRLSAAEFGQWVSAYNNAGIDIRYMPPEKTLAQAKACAFVVCSNLLRSAESAKALSLKSIDACDPMFREVDIPYASWRFPRLSPRTWSVLFRLGWAVGYSANAESLSEAKQRARHCAERLVELASEQGSVLFVGHGSLNWFISRYLKRMGWATSQKSPRKYWEFSVFNDYS